MRGSTLIVGPSCAPIGQVPVGEAVARWAASASSGEIGWQPLIVDERRRWRSQHLDLPTPVVMLSPGYREVTARERAHVSRRVLFARDGYRCQYCGWQAPVGQTRSLTIDHVKPAHLYESRAAATTWDNVTTACFGCNQLKGGSLPVECGMYPASTPKEPTLVQSRWAGRLRGAAREYVCSYYGIEPNSI